MQHKINSIFNSLSLAILFAFSDFILFFHFHFQQTHSIGNYKKTKANQIYINKK